MDGDFADLSIASMGNVPEGNIIDLKLYGILIRKTGKGTITIKGEALKKGSDLSITIPVQGSKE
ncbi:hypothetical protein [Brevibacillus sp. SIMBA_076]|uniref:hypothetical protein n=1 Tax=Brevibacillus sp. SIMBA_076 TaxID=3085814 RepID=UPI00397881A1